MSKLISSGPYRRSVLKRYISQMSSPNTKPVFDDIVAEVLKDQGFLWEEKPRSIYEPKQLYDALERYATDWRKYEHLDEHWNYGFRRAFSIFAKPKRDEFLQTLSDDRVLSALKLTKSSGLPLMTSKKDSLTYSLDRERQIRNGEKSPNPCVAYKRTQKENKTRLVWGYPLEMTIMESRFARPLIDNFKGRRTPMAFGLKKVQLGSILHRYFSEGCGTTVCLDFSKFDTTISKTMLCQAFRILGTWFSKEEKDKWGWDSIVAYFIHTPIVMPNGELYKVKHHGVPSGSYFTQLVDSIVNVAAMYALQSACGMDFRPEALLVLGDDVIVKVRSVVDVSKYSNYLHDFGLILHGEEKTVVGEEHFLGATWIKGWPHRSLQELVNQAVFPENFRNYGEDKQDGAEAVLRSYATSYIEGIELVPKHMIASNNMWAVNLPRKKDGDTKYMSGSDKFLAEEYGIGSSKSRSYYATIGVRFML